MFEHLINQNHSRRSLQPAGRLLLVPLLAFAALASGCASTKSLWDVSKGPVFKPTNYAATGPVPGDVTRVVVLPMHSDAWNAADIDGVERAFAQELNKFSLFELVRVSRDDLLTGFGAASYHSAGAVPGDLLRYFADEFGADAVLFTDLTHFSPYQPISIGVRSKLVGVRDGRPLWSFDTVFDSARPDVQAAASLYHRRLSHPAYPLEDTSAILQSPSRFAKYVAHATYETMPPRAVE